jgi:hypothetical protein
MSDNVVDTDTEAEGWEEPKGAYPEFPENPRNHIYTVSMDGRGPMIVVRGNTPQEVNERYQALLDGGVTTVAASVYSHMKAEMAVASGVGPVSPVPALQGPPAPPQGPTPPPFGPNVSVPGAQGYAGPPALPQPPAQWAPPPAAVQVPSEYQQHGWYKLTVPWPKKDEMAGIVAQYQLRKGRPSEGGKVSWNKADKSWYVAPDVAGAFPQFSPVPA